MSTGYFFKNSFVCVRSLLNIGLLVYTKTVSDNVFANLSARPGPGPGPPWGPGPGMGPALGPKTPHFYRQMPGYLANKALAIWQRVQGALSGELLCRGLSPWLSYLAHRRLSIAVYGKGRRMMTQSPC